MISAMKNLLTEKPHRFMRIYSVLINNFFYLATLTVFFIFTEFAYFILCNKSYLDNFVFVSNKMQLPISIVPGILFFIIAQLLLHFIFCVLVALFSALLIDAFQVKSKHHLLLFITVWYAAVFTVLAANGYYFPNSHFAGLCTVFFSHKVLGYFLVTSILIGFVALSSRRRPGSILIITLALILIYFYSPTKSFTSTATPTQPNIIIVGVDSLRPDILTYFGGEAHTPFMSKFLKQATVFNEAITPLARTYPSWVGILTGQYPRQTGVRTNLSGVGKINLSQTLPALLRQQGYETLYATDETRFSNVDKRFGFDSLITPPAGLNDFLLGTFNDFPLSNLIVNTWVGKWLFPNSYANRAAYVTYDPNSFLKLLHSALLRDHHQSLFLAVHFCLPHHPYIYDRVTEMSMNGQQRYLQSIQRVDQQINDFFALLNQAHLLDHAVVVLLSDHGEALEFAGDRVTEREAYLPSQHVAPEFYPLSKDNKLAMNQSVGHGGDVLSLPQFHSLLAFRFYGLGAQRVGEVSGAVTLLDIKPTLLDVAWMKRSLFHPGNIVTTRPRTLDETKNVSSRLHEAISLLPLITGTTTHPPTRMLFLESDYSPEAVRTIYPEVSKLLLQGADLFQVNPTNLCLTVKPQMVEMIIKSKQYAVIYDEWMLALYPQSDHTRLPVLINLKSGVWTTELNSTFAQASSAQAMLSALQTFYGEEIRS